MATPPGSSPSPPSTPTPAAPGPQPPSSPPPAPAAPPSTPTIPPSTPTTPPPSTSPPSSPPPSTPPPSTPPVIPSTPPPSSPPPVTPSPPPLTPIPSSPTPVPPPSSPPVVPVPAPPSGGTPPPAQPPPTPSPPVQPPATPATPSSPSPPAPKSSPPKKPPVGSPPPAPAVPSLPGETPPPTSPPFNATPPSQPAVPPLSPISPSSPSPPSPADPNPGITPPAPPGAQSPPGVPVSKNPSAASPANSTSSPSGSSGTTVRLVVGIGVAVVVVGLLVGIVVWLMRKKRNTEGNGGAYMTYPGNFQSPIVSSQVSESPQPKSPSDRLIKTSSSSLAYSPSEGGLGHSRSWFTLEELTKITNGFSPQNLLGEGGFGSVYKGVLSDGREVAVKQLKVGGGQGEREFQAEVEIISRVHHRHLVTLVGYCISDNQRLLVYDYVPNDTLHYHLHGPGRPVLHWATRVKIAVGAARGIAYLHEDCHPRIIHRDIKSSNILLDDSFEARVADFGLAKLTVDAETHVTTRVMGTFGYLAPEYASSGKLTDRSDVYSFGVVLLELITGRKPVDTTRPLGDESLVEWARPLMTHALETGNLDNIPDVRLQGNYDEMEMFRMIEVAAACVRHSAPMRPRMGLVMRALDNLADTVDLHNGVRPGQSELFNAGANSEEIRIFRRMAFGGPDLSSDYSRSSWMSQRDTGPG